MRFLLLLLLFVSQIAWAKANSDYLLVITSQRNAETVAEAARLFHLAHPKQKHLTIKARTANQLWQMPQADSTKLINQSQGVLAFGLFGASVANLTSVFEQASNRQQRIIINSDHRLVALSQFNGQLLFPDLTELREIAKSQPGANYQADLAAQIARYPDKAVWLQARGYWHAAGASNTAQLFAWFFNQLGDSLTVKPAEPTPQLRWYVKGQFYNQLTDSEMALLDKDKPVIAIVDHAGGGRPADAKLLRNICQQASKKYNSQCIAALAYWGEAGVIASKQLLPYQDKLTAVIMLQDFVIGGGEGREAVTQVLTTLNVPVLKAIKLRDRTAVERQLSSDGLAQDKVYYQVAMPELQGTSQPLVIATLGQPTDDAITGIRVQGVVAETSGITSLLTRIERWQTLQTKANQDKRIAIVYYNHPPGRHNIGADNLDVPASLWQILNQLKAAGYNTGTLPASQAELLDMMQARGVNLPKDAKALATMSPLIEKMTAADYQKWFATLPATVRYEMEQGPFGLLHQQLTTAITAGKTALADDIVHHAIEEMHHLLEGVDHKGRERALALLDELETCYHNTIDKVDTTQCMSNAPKLISAIQQTGIEGLGGWGQAPGQVMVYQDQLLLPGLTFGNVFIGPQPPRGWEINEELLHANLAFPPPHQYLAFYHYLKNQFKADAFVHLGRHSTYEFLPRRSVGVAADDYSRIIAGDVPGIYPYIVDGVGEGIQAKRRGLAVMVDHLTPPLASTPLYDELLQLRQLVESFEANHSSGDNELVAQRLMKQILEKVDALELKDELAEAMSAELAVMGISFDEVDDDMLVHEVGHYLTDLQERFMPLGLHVFGQDWQANAIDMMIESMLSKSADNNATQDDETVNASYASTTTSLSKAQLTALLKQSPQAEMTGLIKGLDGGYIAPGQGNDPIRSPASLPTGRNFYALDSSLIPSRVAWQLGQEMAQAASSNNSQNAEKSEAVILWASDVVRDEGVMIAFGLDMLGLEPIWNSRGLVKGLKHQTAAIDGNKVRRDIVFTTSGLFRDLYGQQMVLLDKAVLLALDASSDTIRRDYPALSLALSEALASLGKLAQGGTEPLSTNQVAAHWVKQAQALLLADVDAKQAGISASLRVFGDAPGSYGAGINRLVERSGAWQKREELAQVYLRRLGHSYGNRGFGAPAQAAFKSVLSNVENTYFGRSSNLYGLIDNNDAFDYLGGLSLAIESITGKAPNNFVIDHSDPAKIKTRPLGLALRQELRGRFLNPEWLKGLMKHDYAGARTMGNEFLEYLWGWQVTNPTLVGDWAWQEVKAVYIDDKYQLELDKFLSQGHNAHVKSNMLAIMLVAVHKGFWQADAATIEQLATEFADLVDQNGLPGSGHTDPDNPMLPWLAEHLAADKWQVIKQAIASAKGNTAEQDVQVHRISEIELTETDKAKQAPTTEQQSVDSQATEASENQQGEEAQFRHWQVYLAIVVALLLLAGFYRNRQLSQRLQQSLDKE
ncbi:cobaltochelatase subunit CobN [Catenovulum sp. SM1970]|uniref:cobaltochelatase subunit CobN n=1 Tax=Marinifaba aquimaris TaxID=2741323 RepID=UPI00157322E1|nr:cobaltochelatase subunit CobN [Marinifaba aquimaris]NTS76306.1 cobaltochelatase subunit CobN [Marinifaba aquimaris]